MAHKIEAVPVSNRKVLLVDREHDVQGPLIVKLKRAGFDTITARRGKDALSIIENEILHLTEHDLVLSHYPLEVWNGKEAGVIHIHGHTVFSHKTDLRVHKRFNVCTDFWDFTPIKLSSIKDILNLSTNE